MLATTAVSSLFISPVTWSSDSDSHSGVYHGGWGGEEPGTAETPAQHEP